MPSKEAVDKFIPQLRNQGAFAQELKLHQRKIRNGVSLYLDILKSTFVEEVVGGFETPNPDRYPKGTVHLLAVVPSALRSMEDYENFVAGNGWNIINAEMQVMTKYPHIPLSFHMIGRDEFGESTTSQVFEDITRGSKPIDIDWQLVNR